LPRDAPRERSLHDRACKLGEAASCLNLADIPSSRDKPLAPEAAALVERTRTLAEAGCAAGKGNSCGILSALYLGVGVPADREKSAAFGRKGADAWAASCMAGV